MTTTSTPRDMTLTDPGTHSPYRLAGLGDCAQPDSLESPGALWLARVWEAAHEHYTYDLDDTTTRADLLRMDDHGALHEIADGAVPVYTREVWAVFVDLAAYHEDMEDMGGYAEARDMTHAAQIALYMIAERVVDACRDEIADLLDE